MDVGFYTIDNFINRIIFGQIQQTFSKCVRTGQARMPVFLRKCNIIHKILIF